MEISDVQVEEEMEDLRREIEKFREERERVRQIIGQIGGVPTFNTRTFNVVFIVLLVGCLVISLFSEDTLQLAMLEIATAAVSAKLIYLIQ